MNSIPDHLADFMATEAPARPKSKLAPYRAEIETLREAGYTLKQICKYLSGRGVVVEPSLLSKFLRGKVEGKGTAPIASAEPLPVEPENSQERPAAPPSGEQPTKASSPEELMRKHPGLTRKQAEEMFVDQFERPKTQSNTLLARVTRKPNG